MELLDIIRTRRSIRKYQDREIEREKLDLIVEAGLYAPNPGGRQGTRILLLDDPEMIEKIGVVNADCENRNWDVGVSKDQPSIIDDKNIKSGFYGCRALAMLHGVEQGLGPDYYGIDPLACLFYKGGWYERIQESLGDFKKI